VSPQDGVAQMPERAPALFGLMLVCSTSEVNNPAPKLASSL